MTDKQIMNVIKKLIDNSKSGSLRWINMENNSIRPKPFLQNIGGSRMFGSDLIADYTRSFYSEYKHGRFFLMLYEPTLTFTNIPVISLIIETDNTKHATTLIDTDYDNLYTEEIVQLKRLFNIVENNTPEISSFLNEFLDD